jgi:hypothetical protein
MNPNAGTDLLGRIVQYVIDPAVKVIFTLGLFFFLYGLVEYLWEVKDGKTDGDGRDHMVWGMVGMLIMVSVYGIIALVLNTLELDLGSATDTSRIQGITPGVNFQGR